MQQPFKNCILTDHIDTLFYLIKQQQTCLLYTSSPNTDIWWDRISQSELFFFILSKKHSSWPHDDARPWGFRARRRSSSWYTIFGKKSIDLLYWFCIVVQVIYTLFHILMLDTIKRILVSVISGAVIAYAVYLLVIGATAVQAEYLSLIHI